MKYYVKIQNMSILSKCITIKSTYNKIYPTSIRAYKIKPDDEHICVDIKDEELIPIVSNGKIIKHIKYKLINSLYNSLFNSNYGPMECELYDDVNMLYDNLIALSKINKFINEDFKKYLLSLNINCIKSNTYIDILDYNLMTFYSNKPIIIKKNMSLSKTHDSMFNNTSNHRMFNYINTINNSVLNVSMNNYLADI